MKLRCINGCKVRGKSKFYKEWTVHIKVDSKCEERGIDEDSWQECDNSYHCVKCHEVAEEIR